jgi:hypothetical protein
VRAGEFVGTVAKHIVLIYIEVKPVVKWLCAVPWFTWGLEFVSVFTRPPGKQAGAYEVVVIQSQQRHGTRLHIYVIADWTQ